MSSPSQTKRRRRLGRHQACARCSRRKQSCSGTRPCTRCCSTQNPDIVSACDCPLQFPSMDMGSGNSGSPTGMTATTGGCTAGHSKGDIAAVVAAATAGVSSSSLTSGRHLQPRLLVTRRLTHPGRAGMPLPPSLVPLPEATSPVVRHTMSTARDGANGLKVSINRFAEQMFGTDRSTVMDLVRRQQLPRWVDPRVNAERNAWLCQALTQRPTSLESAFSFRGQYLRHVADVPGCIADECRLVPFTATEVMTVVRRPSADGQSPGPIDYIVTSFHDVAYAADSLSESVAAEVRALPVNTFLPEHPLTRVWDSPVVDADVPAAPPAVPFLAPLTVPKAYPSPAYHDPKSPVSLATLSLAPTPTSEDGPSTPLSPFGVLSPAAAPKALGMSLLDDPVVPDVHDDGIKLDDVLDDLASLPNVSLEELLS